MLIKGLLDLIYNILDLILFTELPEMPDSLLFILDEMVNYVVMGISVLRVFLGDITLQIFSVLFTLVLTFNSFYMIWSLVFWILRKIPMLNIKE